ncbi:hypothetical protein A33Q_3501 [Indibacter alkaliphilus LW1]|uniref:Uncharacterized protein n=1 Tax=Indibacter alkaliphilus (strain CCUG 57479 / KCTC 22604 / LW1) TaxID=1189612 RepID=S2D988_INDAL|nr:hypothetical protein A33Q_3501 [Indibacter alkaliphilus LW1]
MLIISGIQIKKGKILKIMLGFLFALFQLYYFSQGGKEII